MVTDTKPAYSPGLAGVIAGETAICSVDPNSGLLYRGYDIHDMASKATFEEVAYLLLNGELPNSGELANFTNQLAAERTLPGCDRENAAAFAEDHAPHGYVAHRRIDAGRVRQGSQ